MENFVKLYKMYCTVFVWLIFINSISTLTVKYLDSKDIKRIIDIIQRRYTDKSDVGVLDTAISEEDLPEAEPERPGHSLLQPTPGMLQSSIKYPREVDGANAVYGNLNNLGITYGKTNQRWLSTNFRKSSGYLAYLLWLILKRLENENKLLTSNKRASETTGSSERYYEDEPEVLSDIDNSATEVSDECLRNNLVSEVNRRNALFEIIHVNEFVFSLNESNEDLYSLPTRRKSYKPTKASKYRDRFFTDTETIESSSSGSSDYERNPGNPYTVHKDKYKQNWLWNHVMDGSHMNVNPNAPQFNSLGPSGAALFFGRKWWYYNQDDFQPLN